MKATLKALGATSLALCTLTYCAKRLPDAPLKFERLETRMDFAIIGRRNSMAVIAKLLVQALGRGGEMFCLGCETVRDIDHRAGAVIGQPEAGLDARLRAGIAVAQRGRHALARA